MLAIRKAQIEALAEGSFQSFCAELSRILCRIMPDATGSRSSEELLDSVKRRVGKAMALGIDDRQDLRRFLECSYLLNWAEGEPDDSAQRVFARTDLNMEEKLDQIEQRTAAL
jgi:hypothetical protein